VRRREAGLVRGRSAGRWGRLVRAVVAMPGEQLVVRGIVLVSGVGALAVAAGGHPLGAGVIALLVLPAAFAAVVAPGGSAAALVMTGAAVAWVVRYGLDTPSLGLAAVEAALLYLHHLSAALLVDVGPRASLAPAVLRRWSAHAGTVLGLTVAATAVLAAVGRPAASTPLELIGLAAAAGLAAALVALARG
jgi:hypothetical protein